MLDQRRHVPVADDVGPRWARAVTRLARRSVAAPPDLAVAITARTAGTGADVVLVPGLAVSDYLEPVQRRLAETMRVHLLDLPGVGQGADVRGTPTLREDTGAVLTWIREHLDGPAVLVGHSYGTQLAAGVAEADGSLVHGLVLASPTVDPAVRSARGLLTRWRRDLASQPEGLAGLNRPQRRRAGLARPVAMGASMLTDDIGRRLVQVDAPLAVLVGTGDVFCTQAWGRSLADRDGGTFTDVAGGTHTFPFDRPDALVTAVRHLRREDENR